MSDEDIFSQDALELQDINITSDDKLKRVSLLAEEMLLLEKQITKMEDELDTLKKHYRELSERKLPEAMLDVGMKSFELNDGSSVSVKVDVHTGIAEKDKVAAFKWLRDNGYGDLIKNEIKVRFGMGEDERANVLKKYLDFNNEGRFEYDEKTVVLPQTLKAFAKELRRKGKELPDNLFAVHWMNVAKIKRQR